MKSVYFATLVLLLTLPGCAENDEDLPGAVRLRVENNSGFSFDNVEIVAGNGGTSVFQDVEPGGASEYARFNFIYSYAYVRVTIGDEEYRLVPTDYVGEQKYYFGSYTYVISFSDLGNPNSLILTFRQD